MTVAVACRRLGISDRTLRRRVERGELVGEYIPRPQGTALYVKLPDDVAAEDAAPDSTAASDQENAHAAFQAALTAALAPISEALEVERTERQALAQDVGQLRERAAAAETERDLLRAELERARARPWWRLW